MNSEPPQAERPPAGAQRLLALVRARPAVSFAAIICLSIAALLAAKALGRSESTELIATLEELRDAVVAGQIPRIMALISPHFYEEGLDKRELAAQLIRALPTRPVRRAVIVVRDLERSGMSAVVLVHVQSFHFQPLGARGAETEWRVALERVEGRWLVRSATPLRLNGQRVAGLRSILAMAP